MRLVNHCDDLSNLYPQFMFVDEEDTADVSTTSQTQSFNTGDLVWGQIRGFPSWPGKLVDTDNKEGPVEEGKVILCLLYSYKS